VLPHEREKVIDAPVDDGDGMQVYDPKTDTWGPRKTGAGIAGIKKWVRGRLPSMSTVRKLAAAAGVSVAAVLGAILLARGVAKTDIPEAITRWRRGNKLGTLIEYQEPKTKEEHEFADHMIAKYVAANPGRTFVGPDGFLYPVKEGRGLGRWLKGKLPSKATVKKLAAAAGVTAAAVLASMYISRGSRPDARAEMAKKYGVDPADIEMQTFGSARAHTWRDPLDGQVKPRPPPAQSAKKRMPSRKALALRTNYQAHLAHLAAPAPSATEPRLEMIVTGGGARNRAIMQHIRELFREIALLDADALGFSGDAKEAVAFAFFAAETVRGRCANMPAVTGAARPALLGKICPA
jgi:hypothetical protein